MLAQIFNRMKTTQSPEELRDLIMQVTDSFMERDEEVCANERRIFGDILVTTLDMVAANIRATIIEMISDNAEIDAETALRLASHPNDEVALPMLEFSPALAEDDLVDIARTQSELRQTAIAKREVVTQKLSDALIAHGSAKVLQTLSGNMYAAYSPKGLEKLLARVGDDPVVQVNFAERGRLDEQFAAKVRRAVSSELRHKLGDFVTRMETGAFEAIVDNASETISVRIQADEAARNETHKLMDGIEAGTTTADEAIMTLALSGHVRGCVWLIHRVLNLKEETVQANFSRKEHIQFSVLARAAGISDDTFTVLTRKRLERLGLSPIQLGEVVDTYKKISAEQARRALRLVRMREKDGISEPALDNAMRNAQAHLDKQSA